MELVVLSFKLTLLGPVFSLLEVGNGVLECFNLSLALVEGTEAFLLFVERGDLSDGLALVDHLELTALDSSLKTLDFGVDIGRRLVRGGSFGGLLVIDLGLQLRIELFDLVEGLLTRGLARSLL